MLEADLTTVWRQAVVEPNEGYCSIEQIDDELQMTYVYVDNDGSYITGTVIVHLK